ncbi:MAG: tRNA (N6-isopentenyl adenosine(37)-C2)-methylthiotransferase MiaB [Magnetococcales bacterium]|nr:tRNA (N6-isopentenyl adenosine(37)-C2)-methylthiotransferase MiaB [Magnetococcales bacterium]MBF0323018.1 tRNA (N6-isopentenyl adenosine(37)-C2)-methylthiotransferase MiaB [Magnetococcales bacterium]
MQRVHIKTFGCQMNAYDASRMADVLEVGRNWQVVADPEQADLIIFNTCHIREKAGEKLFSELGRLHKGLRGRPVRFAVGGCVGQAEGAAIFRRAPFVDLVFGPQNYHRLPLFLERLSRGEQRICATDPATESKFDVLPMVRSHGVVASVTIQEGCDRFCAYCVVPTTRGREWSRGVEEVLAEVTDLASQGVVEITLLGQNVNAYQGADRHGRTHDLAALIRRVAQVEGVKRLRFVTSHPADMTDALVEVFAQVPQLCPYLHLPIQSGSDRVLTRMGRGHTVAEYLAWVGKLRRAVPDMALASDFIVGFPGESDADFQQTLDLVEQVGFAHAYSFKFSPRPGTSAATLPQHIPEEVSAKRLEFLQARLDAEQLAGNQRQVGRVVQLLVEGVSKRREGEVTGRTADFRRVNIPGPAAWIGRMLQVEITEGMPHSLKGRPIT